MDELPADAAPDVGGQPRRSVSAESDHRRNTELLGAELPDPRFVDSAYLRWLYDLNPWGTGFTAQADEDGVRVAHYAVIPQQYRSSAGPARMVFSLNAVTRSGTQRRGYFTTLGEQVYAAAARWGALGVVGVSNANSTPPVVRKLGFRLMGPLPVHVLPALAVEQGVQHLPVDEALLVSTTFEELTADLDRFPARAWTNHWTTDALRWRLAAPNLASPYWLHVGRDVVAISALGSVGGRRFPVVLKLLPRHGLAGPVSGMGLVGALCRHHRRPFAVHAGFNRHVRLRGVRPPRRLQPSPLNLIFRSLSDELPATAFTLDTFEFLDMDAY